MRYRCNFQNPIFPPGPSPYPSNYTHCGLGKTITYARTHARTRTRMHTLMHKHTHTPHAHAHAQRTRTRTRTCTLTRTRTRTHTHTHTYTYAHNSRTNTHAHTHVHTLTKTHTHAHTHTHTHTHEHACMHARTHARTHARMHARMHTHAHTSKHILSADGSGELRDLAMERRWPPSSEWSEQSCASSMNWVLVIRGWYTRILGDSRLSPKQEQEGGALITHWGHNHRSAKYYGRWETPQNYTYRGAYINCSRYNKTTLYYTCTGIRNSHRIINILIHICIV